MNEIHITGLIQTVWNFEGDTYLRVHMDPHRHSVGGRRQDRIAVRVPPHVSARTPLETGRHLSFFGYVEAEANGTVEDDLRRRLRRGGRRGPDSVERLIDETPTTVRRLQAREEIRLVAERIEELPRPRRGSGQQQRRTGRANGRRPNPGTSQPRTAAAAPPAPAGTPDPASETVAESAETGRTGIPLPGSQSRPDDEEPDAPQEISRGVTGGTPEPEDPAPPRTDHGQSVGMDGRTGEFSLGDPEPVRTESVGTGGTWEPAEPENPDDPAPEPDSAPQTDA